MAVKLQLNSDRISGGRSYTCSADTRNGACPNNVTETKYVGKGDEQVRINLCRRHSRLYDSEMAELRGAIAREHDSGLHGEGDDRKAFADPHARNTYFELRCGKCLAEIASESLGVDPDQVSEALGIKTRKEEHEASVLKFTERFTKMVEQQGPVHAVSYYAEDAKQIEFNDKLWKRVEAFEQGAFSWNGEAKMNIVDAYKAVVEEKKQDLLNNHVRDEDERHIVSLWVRGRSY